MNYKDKIYKLMTFYNIKTTDLIAIHIEKFPYQKGTAIDFRNDEIRVISKSSHGMCYIMTITIDSHVYTAIMPQ